MNKDPKTTEDTTKMITEMDDALVRKHLRELMRSSVEKTLNSLLDAEADALCGAKRCLNRDWPRIKEEAAKKAATSFASAPTS